MNTQDAGTAGEETPRVTPASIAPGAATPGSATPGGTTQAAPPPAPPTPAPPAPTTPAAPAGTASSGSDTPSATPSADGEDLDEARDTAPDGLVTPPPVATREPTGDVVVDAALEEFDRVTGEPLDAHVEVGEKVHRTLQARLADLGDE